MAGLIAQREGGARSVITAQLRRAVAAAVAKGISSLLLAACGRTDVYVQSVETAERPLDSCSSSSSELRDDH